MHFHIYQTMVVQLNYSVRLNRVSEFQDLDLGVAGFRITGCLTTSHLNNLHLKPLSRASRQKRRQRRLTHPSVLEDHGGWPVTQWGLFLSTLTRRPLSLERHIEFLAAAVLKHAVLNGALHTLKIKNWQRSLSCLFLLHGDNGCHVEMEVELSRSANFWYRCQCPA